VLSQHPVDRTLLHPVLDICRRQLAEAGLRPTLRTVLAGSGYVSEENFARADDGGLRLLAPLAKDPPGAASALRNGPGAPAGSRPPPAPHGACTIPAAATITRCGPAPWNQCSGSSRAARN
jgi:hypothetical protein